MMVLHFHVKSEYFKRIQAGIKLFEFRLLEKWSKRIEGKTFTHIIIYDAYKKASNDTVMKFEWNGAQKKRIKLKFFGKYSVSVYAFNLEKRVVS